MPVTVKRLSDQKEIQFNDIDEKSHVRSVKSKLRKEFAPKYKNGCRLIYNGKVLKSRHRLSHYRFQNHGVIEMDDRKNWSSSSSSSSSED